MFCIDRTSFLYLYLHAPLFWFVLGLFVGIGLVFLFRKEPRS